MKKLIILGLVSLILGCSNHKESSSKEDLSQADVQQAIKNTPKLFNTLTGTSLICLNTRLEDKGSNVSLCPKDLFANNLDGNSEEGIRENHKNFVEEFSKKVELIGKCDLKLNTREKLSSQDINNTISTNEVEISDKSYIAYNCIIKIPNLATDDETKEFISYFSPQLTNIYKEKKLVTPKYLIREISIINDNNSLKVIGFYSSGSKSNDDL